MMSAPVRLIARGAQRVDGRVVLPAGVVDVDPLRALDLVEAGGFDFLVASDYGRCREARRAATAAARRERAA